MSRRVEVLNADGQFHHYASRGDAIILARDGQADWSDGHQRQLLMRAAVLRVKGKLNIWCPVACSDPSIPRVEGCAPKFSVLQLV